MNLTVISCKEAKAQGLKHYFTGKPCKRGHVDIRLVTGGCRSCCNEGRKAEYNANPEKAKLKLYKFREQNPESFRQIQRNYYARHCDKLKAQGAQYRALRLKRVPAWWQKDAIEKFYASCPDGYEVDHIYPLLGEFVSGLHVLENLQYLTRKDNRAKKNRVEL